MTFCLCFSALWNLGKAYEMANNIVKATELLRECLAIREKSLSATHPDLIDGMAYFVQHDVCGGLENEADATGRLCCHW